jgi:hypothetical protein
MGVSAPGRIREGCWVSRMWDAHDAALEIVKDQVQIVEMSHTVQAGGQVLEQFGQTAEACDGFGDFEQGLLARSGRFAGGPLGGEPGLKRPRAPGKNFL